VNSSVRDERWCRVHNQVQAETGGSGSTVVDPLGLMGSDFDSGVAFRAHHGSWLAGLALVGLAACGLWAPLRSPEKGGATWHELTSEHFDLFTDALSSDARGELQEFEALRDALEQLAFPSGEARERRVSIVLFARHADYLALSGTGTIGLESPSSSRDIERRPTIRLAGDAILRAREIFLHEEVHELMYRAYGNTPRWLNEGLAQYYSSLRIEDNRAVPGTYILAGIGVARQDIPSVVEILGAGLPDFDPTDNKRTAARFYAGAWFLVHMLLDGPNTYRPRFNAFLRALSAGDSAEGAWHDAMAGIDPSRLEDDFRAHVSASSWPLYAQQIQLSPPAAISERTMRPAEVHLLWARLAQPDPGGDSLAAREIDEAAGLEPNSPEVAYVRGCAAWAEKAKDAAAQAFEAALSVAPREPRYLFGVALATGDCGSSAIAPKNTALCDSLVATASSPEENALAAQFLWITGRQKEALRRSEEAFSADMRCAPCALVLAGLRARTCDMPGAIEVLEQSLSVSGETPLDRLLVARREKYRLLGGSRCSP
jgi:hypothetical protein